MASNRPGDDDLDLARRVKRLTIASLVSDDDLYDLLVLKGGNAIEYAGIEPVRHSIDVDFSIDGQLDSLGSTDQIGARFESLLMAMFEAEGLLVFDVRFEERPPNVTHDVLGRFWGGYELLFKVIPGARAVTLSRDQRRRMALPLGKADRKEFRVDLSGHEYCEDKRVAVIGGFNVQVYSDRMIVCEKIRAICQQMPAYREIVRSSSRRPRARDFFDIHHIVTSVGMDVRSPRFRTILRRTFEAKRVPLDLLGEIGSQREYHRDNFESVRATVRSSVDLQDFDVYVEFLVDLLRPLEAFRDVDPPPP